MCELGVVPAPPAGPRLGKYRQEPGSIGRDGRRVGVRPKIGVYQIRTRSSGER